MYRSTQDGTIKIDFKNGLSLMEDDNIYISTSDDASTMQLRPFGKIIGATELKFGRMGGSKPGCTIDNEYIEKAIVAEEERKRQEEIVKPTQQKEEESSSKISKLLSTSIKKNLITAQSLLKHKEQQRIFNAKNSRTL